MCNLTYQSNTQILERTYSNVEEDKDDKLKDDTPSKSKKKNNDYEEKQVQLNESTKKQLKIFPPLRWAARAQVVEKKEEDNSNPQGPKVAWFFPVIPSNIAHGANYVGSMGFTNNQNANTTGVTGEQQASDPNRPSESASSSAGPSSSAAPSSSGGDGNTKTSLKRPSSALQNDERMEQTMKKIKERKHFENPVEGWRWMVAMKGGKSLVVKKEDV